MQLLLLGSLPSLFTIIMLLCGNVYVATEHIEMLRVDNFAMQYPGDGTRFSSVPL